MLWYKDCPKLLSAKILNVSGSSLIISIVIVMPWKTELAQLLTLNSFKFIGQPFFKTSFELFPFNSIIVLECERSVTAKFLTSHFFLVIPGISLFLETTSQLLGPFQRILFYHLNLIPLNFLETLNYPNLLKKSS